ncbi:MAG: hypothetical protein AAF547_14780 [Actinomycetota bacterium]
MIGLVAGAVILAGCSASFSFGGTGDDDYLDAGTELIEGQLADQIGLGALDAECTGADLEAGDTFTCTAQAGDLSPIRFIGTIDADGDGVNITSSNLLLAEQVEEVEAFSASLIAEQTAVPIGPEHFECADSSLVVENGDILDCVLTDPTDGTMYEAPVTIEDLDSMSVVVNVGDPIG